MLYINVFMLCYLFTYGVPFVSKPHPVASPAGCYGRSVSSYVGTELVLYAGVQFFVEYAKRADDGYKGNQDYDRRSSIGVLTRRRYVCVGVTTRLCMRMTAVIERNRELCSPGV